MNESVYPLFIPPDVIRVNALFGNKLHLLGYQLHRDENQLTLTLHWHSEHLMKTDYRVFVHVFDPTTGLRVAQDDSMPLRWTYPTTYWPLGKVVPDAIPLSLEGALAGGYRIAVGVYDLATMKRLLVVDRVGQPQSDAQMLLPGEMIEVDSFVDGKERMEFLDPVGPLDVYHVGHPEPVTLSRVFKTAKIVDDKATFHPPFINDLIRSLGQMVREANGPIRVNGMSIDPMDFAASYFYQKCKSLKNIPKEGALRVDVKGKRNGESKIITYTSSGVITSGLLAAICMAISLPNSMLSLESSTMTPIRPPCE